MPKQKKSQWEQGVGCFTAVGGFKRWWRFLEPWEGINRAEMRRARLKVSGHPFLTCAKWKKHLFDNKNCGISSGVFAYLLSHEHSCSGFFHPFVPEAFKTHQDHTCCVHLHIFFIPQKTLFIATTAKISGPRTGQCCPCETLLHLFSVKHIWQGSCEEMLLSVTDWTIWNISGLDCVSWCLKHSLEASTCKKKKKRGKETRQHRGKWTCILSSN